MANGRQYIITALGGGGSGSSYVASVLPQSEIRPAGAQ